MQYIHSQFIIKAIQNTLKQATYKPINNDNKNLIPYLSVPCTPKTHTKVPFWKKRKSLLQFVGVLALILPTKSLTYVSDSQNMATIATVSPVQESVEPIQEIKSLTVAITPEHLFINDEHRHGFGYDVINRYAHHLGAKLTLKRYKNDESALKALQAGDVDMVIGSDLDSEHSVSTSLGCEPSALANFGIADAELAFNKHNTPLIDRTKAYLCSPSVAKQTKTIAKFYQTNALDAYSVRHFNQALKERLPKFKSTFQSQAKKYDQDWHLLAAISYQESHLNPSAVSRTGVEGLMMLTRETASELGVSDRTNPIQSIQGGAKYLDKLESYFTDVDESERLWFVLAAYNMGPNAVKNIQKRIKAQGNNPNSWTHFYTYLSHNAKKNGRYVQCMHYVTNIRTYLEAIKGKSLSA